MLSDNIPARRGLTPNVTMSHFPRFAGKCDFAKSMYVLVCKSCCDAPCCVTPYQWITHDGRTCVIFHAKANIQFALIWIRGSGPLSFLLSPSPCQHTHTHAHKSARKQTPMVAHPCARAQESVEKTHVQADRAANVSLWWAHECASWVPNMCKYHTWRAFQKQTGHICYSVMFANHAVSHRCSAGLMYINPA